MNELEQQVEVWSYYKPRHTHAWNMLVLSHAEITKRDFEEPSFEYEYLWENFIIRLWLYRVSVNALAHLDIVKTEVDAAIAKFDRVFDRPNGNALRSIRNMIEHFDDYAAGKGRGPALRDRDLDPWRAIGPDRFERGSYAIERDAAYSAAINLRASATRLSKQFTDHYKKARG